MRTRIIIIIIIIRVYIYIFTLLTYERSPHISGTRVIKKVEKT